MLTVASWRLAVQEDISAIEEDVRRLYDVSELRLHTTQSWNAILHGSTRGQEYCVKVINEKTASSRRSYVDLSCGLKLACALRKGGFPDALAPIKSRRGRYVHRCGGYWTIIFPWIHVDHEHGPFTEDGPQSLAAATHGARVLAQMHDASTRCQMKVIRRSLPEVAQAYSPSVWSSKAREIWDIAVQRVRARGGTVRDVKLLNDARKAAADLIRKSPLFFRCRRSAAGIWLHGDFRPENLIPISSDRAILIDFDTVYRARREVDVAYAALSFAGRRWFLGKRDWSICEAFVRSYEATVERQLDMQSLNVSFLWTALKALSLSFKPEQVAPRMRLYSEVRGAISRFCGQ